ncbi:methylated-DNA--[protein]-cysteine S-methyltransferase [Ramlibacter sp. AN1015]|uniref:methylated-DNA--[protein]-cysteine S-methyltransferase n=1 Tax=Ramlibacter sp. AN1015 TaxID=3133428 RepID=UPI0030C2AA91
MTTASPLVNPTACMPPSPAQPPPSLLAGAVVRAVPPRTLRHASPLGPVLLAATADGLCGLWFEGQKHWPHASSAWAEGAGDDTLLREAARQLDAYFADRLHTFSLPLDLSAGTPFQAQVWRALRGIARGSTLTYAQLAERIGRVGAARAVGAAVGRNPLSVVVPCHRVLGQAGALTGYAGGLDRKRALLRLEGAAGA